MNKCNPMPAFITIASTIIIIGMFVLIGSLIFDSVKANRKFKTEDKLAELSTKVYLLEKKVNQLAIGYAASSRETKTDAGNASTANRPQTAVRLANGKKVLIPNGAELCPICKGKGCGVVNIGGGTSINLVQEKCPDCDGKGYAFKGEKP